MAAIETINSRLFPASDILITHPPTPVDPLSPHLLLHKNPHCQATGSPPNFPLCFAHP